MLRMKMLLRLVGQVDVLQDLVNPEAGSGLQVPVGVGVGVVVLRVVLVEQRNVWIILWPKIDNFALVKKPYAHSRLTQSSSIFLKKNLLILIT